MSVLENFPMKSQLVDTNEVNRQYDCVPTSIAASLQWITGKPFDGAAIKDEVYSKGYVGGTSAKEYVSYCAEQGVRLSMVDAGSFANTVKLAHSFLAQQKPVIYTQYDPYSSDPNMTHVCTWYADGPGYLIAMDPYPLPGMANGHPVRQPDIQWIKDLRSTQLWILEKLDGSTERIEDDMPPPLTIANAEAAQHFVQSSSTSWHCIATNKVLLGAMLSYYCLCGATAMHGLLELGLPVSNEIPLDNKGNTRQHFERGVLFYDPSKIYDNPPGSGSVYPAQIYIGPGQDPKLAELQTQVEQLQKQPAMPQMEADIKQVQEILGKY